MLPPSRTSSPFVISRLWAYASNGPLTSTRRQPAGASPTTVIVDPALRRVRTGDLGSVWTKTAVSVLSVSAPSAAAKARVSRISLVFIVGGRGHLAVMRRGNDKQGLDFLARKLFHSAQRNSFQTQRPDLVAAEPAHLIAEGGEELADFAFFAVVHVDIQFGGTPVGARIDQAG